MYIFFFVVKQLSGPIFLLLKLWANNNKFMRPTNYKKKIFFEISFSNQLQSTQQSDC